MKHSKQLVQQKQQQILEAAASCFVCKGFHNTTMQDICSEAKMSAGNIYRYFDNKEAIIEAFAEAELQWMILAITDVPLSQDTLQAIVDTLFWTAATLMQDGRSELAAELFAEAGRNPRINAIYSRFNRKLGGEICRMLQEVEDNGILHLRHDKTSIAHITMALVDGLVLNKITNPDLDIMTLRPTIETMVKSLFEKRQGQ